MDIFLMMAVGAVLCFFVVRSFQRRVITNDLTAIAAAHSLDPEKRHAYHLKLYQDQPYQLRMYLQTTILMMAVNGQEPRQADIDQLYAFGQLEPSGPWMRDRHYRDFRGVSDVEYRLCDVSKGEVLFRADRTFITFLPSLEDTQRAQAL